MVPWLRKSALIVHITCSVGWIGALAGFLVLNIAALNSHDVDVVRSSYLAMNSLGCWLIVPLSLAALLTGIVQAMGTEWGLFRYSWVFAKLVLTLFATIILLVKVPLIHHAAQLAAGTTMPKGELQMAGMQLAVHAIGGLLVLLAITTLSVFKPWGKTAFGHHRARLEQRTAGDLMSQISKSDPAVPNGRIRSILSRFFGPDHASLFNGLPLSIKVLHVVIGIGLVGMVLMHLTGHGPEMHGH